MRMLTSLKCFPWSHQYSYFIPDTGRFHRVVTFPKFWCLMIDGNFFFGFNHVEFIHHVVNNSMVILFFWDPFLGMGFLYRSFVGWASAYLFTNSPKIFHSSEECPAPWIIQVFDALFERSTYRLRCFPVLPYFVGLVFVSPL